MREIGAWKKEKNQIGELAEKKTELIKKIKKTLTPIEKRKISEEIKAINNFMREKVRPIKYELNKKIEKEVACNHEINVFEKIKELYKYLTSQMGWANSS